MRCRERITFRIFGVMETQLYRRRLPLVFSFGVVAILLLLLDSTANAFTFQPTETQYYLMPDYCKARMSDFHRNRDGHWNHQFPVNEKQIAYWKRAIGPDWAHMHHYCAGVAWLSLAQNPAEQRRKNYSAKGAFVRAEEEVRYTRNNSRPGSPLWSKLTIDYARAVEGIGNPGKAVDLLAQLLQQEPKNTDVYIAMARTLERQGDLTAAIDVLKQGVNRANKNGPLLFYLARFYYDTGDLEKARVLTSKAEDAGMKMDSLRKKMGADSGSSASAAVGSSSGK